MQSFQKLNLCVVVCHKRGAAKLGERLGSGDGERKTLLTRQIAFEPLPASVLFALGLIVVLVIVMVVDESLVGAMSES